MTDIFFSLLILAAYVCICIGIWENLQQAIRESELDALWDDDEHEELAA